MQLSIFIELIETGKGEEGKRRGEGKESGEQKERIQHVLFPFFSNLLFKNDPICDQMCVA